MDKAFSEAKAIAKSDHTLSLPEHAGLKKRLEGYLVSGGSLIS